MMRLLGGMTNQCNDGQLIGADKRPQFCRLRTPPAGCVEQNCWLGHFFFCCWLCWRHSRWRQPKSPDADKVHQWKSPGPRKSRQWGTGGLSRWLPGQCYCLALYDRADRCRPAPPDKIRVNRSGLFCPAFSWPAPSTDRSAKYFGRQLSRAVSCFLKKKFKYLQSSSISNWFEYSMRLRHILHWTRWTDFVAFEKNLLKKKRKRWSRDVCRWSHGPKGIRRVKKAAGNYISL